MIVAATEKLLEALTALLLFLLMAITVVDVAGRYFVGRPLPGSAEISAIVLALLVFAALPLVSRRREHITVDLFTFAPGSALGRASGAIAITFTSICSVWIAVEVWLLARDLVAHGDTSSFLKIPYAPVAFFIAIASLIAGGFALLRAPAGTRLPESPDPPGPPGSPQPPRTPGPATGNACGGTADAQQHAAARDGRSR